MPNYKRLPVKFIRGEGIYLWDDKGERYLDALAGIAVCGLGHAHPEIHKVICEQAETLLHTSNIYQIPYQQELADVLTHISGMKTAFFCNSGAEANEAAIKIARRYGNEKNIKNPTIITMQGSFHGRTLATLSATGNEKVHAGFEPLVSGFETVPYNDIEAIEKLAEQNKNIVAILVEPIQGEGGINIPDNDYLNKIRQICDKNDWLMMLDEIQTGMGRTGTWFAFQQNNIVPDVLTVAKALGNGLPIGACLAHSKVAQCLQAGSHGSTFGGNPLVCRVALTVIEQISQNNLCQHAKLMGEYFKQNLAKLQNNNKNIKCIRVKGLMIAIELDKPCTELVTVALNKKLLINVTADKVIRLLPPLIINKKQIDEIIIIISDIIKF
jgi:acetylornithine aminotransferase